MVKSAKWLSPGGEHLEYLRGVDSPTLSNAIERFGLRDRTDGFVGGAVRCLFPDRGVMVGHAVTVTVTSRAAHTASPDGYWRMWEAVEKTGAPVVLVIQDVSGAPTRCAQFGEVMATMAKRMGVVGVVTDGGVRDLAEVREIGLHYFAAHIVVSHGNSEILNVGDPVTIDGQLIRSGELVHGDLNGVVIVPEQVLRDIARVVDEVRAAERKHLDYITGASFSLPAYRRDLFEPRKDVGH